MRYDDDSFLELTVYIQFRKLAHFPMCNKSRRSIPPAGFYLPYSFLRIRILDQVE